MKSFKIVIAASILMAACSPKTVSNSSASNPPPTPKPEVLAAQQMPQTLVLTTEEGRVAQGKELFRMNCGRCHELFDPKHLTAEKWEPTLKAMQHQAKLSDEDTALIHDYIFANL